MKIEIARPEKKEAWNLFVNSHRVTLLSHCYEFKALLEKVFGHKGFYLCAIQNENFVGVLPLIFMKSALFGRMMVSLPFLNGGGIIAEDEQTISELWKEAIRMAKDCRVKYLLLRSSFPLPIEAPCSKHKVTFHLNLEGGVDRLWDKVGPKVRNHVRKAQKADLEVRIASKNLLDAFYAVFSEHMRDLGTPVMPKQFFSEILDRLNEKAIIYAVFKNDKPIAASFCLLHGEILEVSWASSLGQFKKDCPNIVLYWSMIEDGAKKSMRIFDFGRCTKGGGTYTFKKQWGAQERELYWYYWSDRGNELPDISPSNPKYSLPIAIWKRFPLWFANWLGPKIVKSIP